jgi:hypothetical protein
MFIRKQSFNGHDRESTFFWGAFAVEYKVRQLIIVSTDPYPGKIDNIMVLPWKVFLEKLWGGEII